MVARWRGKHVFDNLEAHAVGGLLGGGNSFGDHFYVDPSNGAAGNSGTAWNDAKATLAQALALCETGKGDIIHVARGTQTVTSPLEINVRGVIIMADQLYNPMGNGESFTIYGSHTDGPAAIIYQPCIVIGMGFSGSQTTGPSLLIDCDNQGGYNGGFNWLYRCRFSSWLTGVGYALQTIGGALNMIEECTFDGLYYEKDLYGGFNLGCILCGSDVGGAAPFDLVIRKNRFINIGANTKYCITWNSGAIPQTVNIESNYNMGPQKFFNNNGCTNYSTHLIDNWVNGANTEVYNDTIANLILKGVEFSGNHYHEA